MTDQPPRKAVIERLHQTRIITSADGEFRHVRCDTPGCDYESPEFKGANSEYLAELNADEHKRARAGWPGTAPHD